MNYIINFIKRVFLILLFLIPKLSLGQSFLSFSTIKPIGESLNFYIVSSNNIKVEGIKGDIVNGNWSNAIVERPNIKIWGEITIANFTNCEMIKADLSSCPKIKEISFSYNKLEQLSLGSQPHLTSLKVAGNRLLADQMLSLVRSLPNRTGITAGILYAKDCLDSNDLIELTPEMLKEAKSRNWIIKICIYSAEKKHDIWIDYDGKNINSIIKPNVTKKWEIELLQNCIYVIGSEKPLCIQVYSMMGKLLCQQEASLQCPINALPQGSYLVRLSCKENTLTKKIVKRM